MAAEIEQTHETVDDEKIDANHPTTDTDRPNLSTEHQREGDARRPSETLDRGQPDGETIARKSSLT